MKTMSTSGYADNGMTYKIKEVSTGKWNNIAPGITTDTNQVRSSVPDPVRSYDRGGKCSPAMKKVSFSKSKKFGRMK